MRAPGYRGAWWWKLRTVDPDGVVRLVGVILRDTPHLPGAACRGRFELFDDVAREDPALRAARLRAAAALCLGCPARPAYPQSPGG